MNRNTLLVVASGLLLAIVGATLAFALEEPDGALDVQAFGGIILAAGMVILAGGGISAVTGGSGNGSGGAVAGTGVDPNNLKSIVGLIAVVAGIAAVTALTVVTVTVLGEDDSQVALTSSAFGVISAVVSAYLGIKITAESSARATAETKEEIEKAAVAEREAKNYAHDAALRQDEVKGLKDQLER